MANKHLATYLNDHLAGSTAALELLEPLASRDSAAPHTKFFAELKADIEADRQQLESLMATLGVAPSRTRQASAWLAEKMTEFKMQIDDPTGGELRLFESLEGLSLGIEGKRSLWLALATVAKDEPALRVLDYEQLAQRAAEQRQRVEEMRLEMAKQALSGR